MKTNAVPPDKTYVQRPTGQSAAPSAVPEQDDQQAQIRELTRWTIRLAVALRIGLPRSRYPDEAMAYLESRGLALHPYRRLPLLSLKPLGERVQ